VLVTKTEDLEQEEDRLCRMTSRWTPWADAHTAQEERLADLPPRAMLTRAEAMAKAVAFLRAEGSSDVAITATPNPLQGLWIVGHRNPQRPAT
jgi:hypothetical protein